MKVRFSGPLSKERRQQIRDEIPAFLTEPRTFHEVADRFSISGISASAILKGVPGIEFDRETKTYSRWKVYAAKPA